MVFNRMVCINSHKEGCDQLFMEINRFKDDKLALVYNINSIILLITPQIITNWNIFLITARWIVILLIKQSPFKKSNCL